MYIVHMCVYVYVCTYSRQFSTIDFQSYFAVTARLSYI